MKLIRYWFRFDVKFGDSYDSLGLLLGCGVTAFGYEDAIELMKENIFKEKEMPPIKEFVENVDISTLDLKHIAPAMGVPIYRGIWYPGLYFRSP